MITLKIDMDEINYSDIIETIFPLIAEKLKKKANSPLVTAILSKTEGLRGLHYRQL